MYISLIIIFKKTKYDIFLLKYENSRRVPNLSNYILNSIYTL